MPVLSLVNVHHSYGTRAILDGAMLSIEPGEKVGLVGRNGSGKTTLMRVMTGQIKHDSGTVSLQRGARIGYLTQDPTLDPADSVRDAAEGAFAQLHDLHVRLHRVFDDMAHAQGEDLERLLKQQAKLEAEIEAAGGYAIDHKIDAMLHGLGFVDEQFTLKVSELSGGQKGRLGLARLLLEEPDVLLLDEPTNHLDIAGRQWLEEFLAEEYRGAVIVVSHDRWLLDRVVHRIIEVERGVIREYPGNYHDYVNLRRERQLTEARVFDKQQDRIRQEQEFIDRYRAGQRARQAKGREARLDRFKENVNERPIELEVMNLRLPPAQRSGDQVVVVEGLGKAYDEKRLFNGLDLSITRGDRIGIIGPNGAGKTTLIKCLLGEVEPNGGTVRLGSRLNIGYYRQLHDHLDMSLTVWQYLQQVIVGLDGSAKASEQQARDLAGAFLFSGSEQDKVLGSLSGGERSRAVLAGLVAGAHNVLVLDEPSNHLDIPSAERLEQALSSGDNGYDGTLLLITHDRQLLQDICDRLIILDGDGGARIFPGRYAEWEERQRRERAEAAERARADEQRARSAARDKQRVPTKTPAAAKPERTPPGPHARLKQEQLEKRLAEAQQRLAEIDQAMLEQATYTDGAKMKALQVDRAHVERELQEFEEEWLRRAEAEAS